MLIDYAAQVTNTLANQDAFHGGSTALFTYLHQGS